MNNFDMAYITILELIDLLFNTFGSFRLNVTEKEKKNCFDVTFEFIRHFKKRYYEKRKGEFVSDEWAYCDVGENNLNTEEIIERICSYLKDMDPDEIVSDQDEKKIMSVKMVYEIVKRVHDHTCQYYMGECTEEDIKARFQK
ncbi:MAG: hypothetical protein Q4B85_12555 [Lachnospiraceae bacterium]|nr:hypothetical protein [Lachnospiraceae bacterium]